MDWLLPYWAAALSTSGIPMTLWAGPALRLENQPPGARIRPPLTANSPVDPSPSARSSWPHTVVDRDSTATWPQWSNENGELRFGQFGLAHSH
jgi:hypothetical protein